MSWEIATCSYGELKSGMGVPVRASLGMPKWFEQAHGTIDRIMELTPRSDYLHSPKPEYERRFFDQMNAAGVERIMKRLNAISNHHQDAPVQVLVLLCFEKLSVGGPGKWCHRTMVRQWFTEHTEFVVPELGETPESKAAKQPPTLF